MNRMLPLMMTAVVMLSFSYAYVYAERSVVEVPFDYTGHGCTFDEELVIYTCKWEGSSETIPSDKSDSGIIPPEQIAEESKEAHDLAVDLKEEISLTPTERKIIQLQEELDNGTITSADRVLLKALQDMNDTCSLGIEHGALIQKFAEFEIPVIDPNTTFKAIDYSKNTSLGNIIKKTIECKMWDEYRVSHLGQRYLDIVVDDSTSQAHHRDRVMTMDIYPNQEYPTELALSDSLTTAQEFICNQSYFDEAYKRSTGCYPEPNPTGGVISMADNIAMKKYTAWLDTGNQNRADLLKSEEVRVHQESLESFAQQHNIDIADLKNLVQSVDDYNEENKP